MKTREERTGITQDMVLKELSSIAFVENDDAYINPRDKIKALELLGRHLNMFTDKVQVSGTLQSNPYEGLTTEELKKLASSDTE